MKLSANLIQEHSVKIPKTSRANGIQQSTGRVPYHDQAGIIPGNANLFASALKPQFIQFSILAEEQYIMPISVDLGRGAGENSTPIHNKNIDTLRRKSV